MSAYTLNLTLQNIRTIIVMFLDIFIMKKVIAIVEDEKDLNELVKRYLEKEGYEVRSYLTFDAASPHTADDDVHLWILDIMWA